MKDISTEEEKRLEALASYDIMDTLPEEELDHITQLASIICETPIALISLLDHQRQWFKSKVGIEAPETPKNISFCQYAIQGMEVYEVENASESDLFKNNPLVTGDPNIRFYAGHPLTTDEGYNLGTLCVIDQKPKKLNANQKKALNVLASSIIQRLEIRKAKESEIKKNKLSELIIDVNKKFNQTEKTKDVFDSMLNGLLNILDCEYGFMGEIIESKNAKYLKTHSITDISWSKETKALFDENVANGLEFKNLNTLFGYTIRTGNELISNNPLSHKESGGLPKGHPPLNSYMGIPIMNSSNDLIAMIGLGNKKQGFKQSDLDFLKPFLSSYANIIQTIQARKNEKRLLTKLQKAQEIGNTGNWEYYFKNNYFEWSENLFAIFEIEDSISSENLFEVYLNKIGEEGKRDTITEFSRCKSTGEPFKIELSFYQSDGERIFLKSSGQPIRNTQQEIIGIEGSMVNVTNEIKTLDRLNNAQRIAKIGSWEFHFKDERLIWSDYHFEIFGIDPKTPPSELYKVYLSRLNESDIQKLQSLIDHSTKTGESYKIDHEITLPDGSTKMIRGNGNVLRDEYNKIIGLQGTAQDITEKYQKDKVLKEKEDRIKAMMDGSIDAIYLLDAFYNSKGEVEDFIFKEINKAGYRELDMKPEELLGKKICEVFPVNITNGFFGNYKLVFETKTNFEQEYELPEGTTAAGWYHHQVTPTETGVAIINRDISDIKQSVQRAQQTEAEVKEMSDRLQSVISAANIGIWNWNPQNNEVEFSDSWKAMLGYQPSEVSNHIDEWSKRVHPDDIEQCFSDIQAHIDGKTEFYRNEHRMLHKNGHWIWILDQGKIAERDQNGNPTKFVGTHLNIDLRKQQEQEIIEVKKEVEQFFDLSVDFMCISDMNGNFEKVNNSFKNILGYSENKFLQSSVLDFAHEDDIEITKDELKNLREGKPVVNFKMRMKCQNGQYRWLNWCAQTNQNGTKVYAAARDVTEEFNLAEIEKKNIELQKEKSIADRTAKNKELFLANMSHEIRTPMNGIIGVLDLLEEAKTDPSDEEIYYLNTIRTSSNTLLNIINDVLDLSKLEAGKTVLRKEDFSIEEAIHQIPSLYKGNALKKNITILTEIDSKLPKYLKSDINRLIQILSNLASNAIKFSDENSEVIIRASLIDKKNDDVKMRFEVTDFGIGISENDQNRLFQAFNQVDLSRTKKFEGTGLGLAICKQLVELFDGNIGVLSNQGQGSTFWFTLNSEIGKAPEKTKSQKNNAHEKFEGTRVLLVDDKNVNLLVAKAMLEKLKCEVTTANNGKEAVNTFKPNLFDIVLMDIQMPELDGLEATKIIQKEHGKSVPIVALTANAMEGDKETYLNSGMDGYIAKPVTLDQLKKVMGSLIG